MSGLYDPEFHHDSCGVAFVATLRGSAGRDIVDAGLTALKNLEHRGAVGAEVDTGDGAGILTQVPDAFLRTTSGMNLPPRGEYAVGIAFLTPGREDEQVASVEEAATLEGVEILGWRDVPTDPSPVGPTARASIPVFRMLFLRAEGLAGIDVDRKAYRVRRRAAKASGVYFASLSSRTLTYKGMVTTHQLDQVFPDLTDPDFASEIALVHSRFSTNTFPSWSLAQPLRFVAHNGEINTIRGNRNWMSAREGLLESPLLGDIDDIAPIVTGGQSDTASFDEVAELLHLGGRSLPHSVLMMIPEAWHNARGMNPDRRAFFRYHALMMQPWDGPAALQFTDGTVVGAVLDRNGLRPGRYWVTDDDLVVVGSEAGLLDIPQERIVRKGRLQPGRMFLVDTSQRRIVEDSEIKEALTAGMPYREWVERNTLRLSDLPEQSHVTYSEQSITRRQRVFGYTEEELRILLAPMATNGSEPLGAMGNDTPPAVLSSRPKLLFDYFTQLFAQVTNPPIDAIRETVVTAIVSAIGPEHNILDPTPEHAKKLVLDVPVLDNEEFAKIVRIEDIPQYETSFRSQTISGLYPIAEGGMGMEKRLEEILAECDRAIEESVTILVLSDRDSDPERAPIPSLLLTSAVHMHLVRRHTRTRVSLIVEAGDVREPHHVALHLGFGAGAVNPYLALETVEVLASRGLLGDVSPREAQRNLIKALVHGVLEIMSKMGISTLSSYRGAQTFEATGLSRQLIDRHFTGTPSKLDGVGLPSVAEEVAQRHVDAFPPSGSILPHRYLKIGGDYQWRREGEQHLFDPESVFKLQHSTRTKQYDLFQEYTRLIDDQEKRLMTLRGLFEFASTRDPVPLEEVEPVSEIVKRFGTGAMSYGSISEEAHTTLAIAMNRLGGRSNTGEGGEGADRLYDPERRSAVKQIASGRFGVTSEYLVNADDIQIKMAQGAKPGEGGHLPGQKVYPWIAKTRLSTPGVSLISPPPHHDIYSIEDLKQLIYDLKCANPKARIHVKLVSEVGIGTVAAGVSKCKADVVLVSGWDGGTGASPLTSTKRAGTPWEIGLADVQQTLVANGLRDRIVVQTDGQLKTGRDVVIAALLGAEEYGFATAPLVVSGCVMMRVCHKDTCPVGVATQNPELRSRYSGSPEYVVTFFEYVARQVREILAELGFRSLDEAIGHAEVLDTRTAVDHWKASGLDLTPILANPPEGAPLRQSVSQDHGLTKVLDRSLIRSAKAALDSGEKVLIRRKVKNTDRSIGTMLGYEVTRRHRAEGLPDDTIVVELTGCAGQSLGAFVPRGITLRLFGEANDYAAKGLSGGRVIVRPDPGASMDDSRDVIAGNVIGYGATGGEIFLRGQVGERFLVRNSGAAAVVEGVGEHALEYMTEGIAVILGPVERNLGAGMSGGKGYVLDLDPAKVNTEALERGDLSLTRLDSEDVAVVKGLLERYVEETESPKAREILADWNRTLGRFTRVCPTQYTKAKKALAEFEARGIDLMAPGAWNDFLEVTYG